MAIHGDEVGFCSFSTSVCACTCACVGRQKKGRECVFVAWCVFGRRGLASFGSGNSCPLWLCTSAGRGWCAGMRNGCIQRPVGFLVCFLKNPSVFSLCATLAFLVRFDTTTRIRARPHTHPLARQLEYRIHTSVRPHSLSLSLSRSRFLNALALPLSSTDLTCTGGVALC